jgi:phosphotransferase system  glucose/maltose/N-acetylglucosamine-specific IIC component
MGEAFLMGITSLIFVGLFFIVYLVLIFVFLLIYVWKKVPKGEKNIPYWINFISGFILGIICSLLLVFGLYYYIDYGKALLTTKSKSVNLLQNNKLEKIEIKNDSYDDDDPKYQEQIWKGIEWDKKNEDFFKSSVFFEKMLRY